MKEAMELKIHYLRHWYGVVGWRKSDCSFCTLHLWKICDELLKQENIDVIYGRIARVNPIGGSGLPILSGRLCGGVLKLERFEQFSEVVTGAAYRIDMPTLRLNNQHFRCNINLLDYW